MIMAEWILIAPNTMAGNPYPILIYLGFIIGFTVLILLAVTYFLDEVRRVK